MLELDAGIQYYAIMTLHTWYIENTKNICHTCNLLVSIVFSFSIDWSSISCSIFLSLFSSCFLSDIISFSLNCSSFSSCDILWSLFLLAALGCFCSNRSLFLPVLRSGSPAERQKQHNLQSHGTLQYLMTRNYCHLFSHIWLAMHMTVAHKHATLLIATCIYIIRLKWGDNLYLYYTHFKSTNCLAGYYSLHKHAWLVTL